VTLVRRQEGHSAQLRRQGAAGPEQLLVILVESLAGATREYLLAAIARQYRIWLFQSVAPTWELPYLAGHTVVDTLDAREMAAAAAGLGASGVLCWEEVRIEAAAGLANALGLAGSGPAAVHRCRDKHLTRTALADAGVPQPESVAVASVAEATREAARIGYPVVLKPRALAGSYGVVKVESPAGLTRAYQHAVSTTMIGVPTFDSGVLVEEYADGPEVSIDAISSGGGLIPLYLARKQLGFPPYFEETGHVVDAADPLASDAELLAVLGAAHKAVGLAEGWTHTEIRLTSRGPRVVEINARIGGDMIPYLGALATGIDPGLVAAALACRQPLPVTPSRSGVAAVRFLYPPHDLTTERVAVHEAGLPPGTELVRVLAQPGQQVRLPPAGHIYGRFAFAVVTGKSAAECSGRLDRAAAAITITGSRLSMPE
jgi:biotin carboxylase